MSTFSKKAKRFTKDLIRGNVAEVIFERLAVQSDWHVKYNGIQYGGILPLGSKEGDNREVIPDFIISRRPDLSDPITVEIKYQESFDKTKSVHKKGKEDIRVILSPGGTNIVPNEMRSILKIPVSDWKWAQDLLQLIQLKALE